MRISLPLVVLTLSAAFVAPRVASAQELLPFTEVKSACPNCPEDGLDVIKLKNGKVVNAVIVAENPTFLCLEHWGEQRAVGRDRVQSVERRVPQTPAQRDAFADQLLFTDKTVLCGKLLNSDPISRYYDIVVPGGSGTHTALKSLVAMAFRAGKEILDEPCPTGNSR